MSGSAPSIELLTIGDELLLGETLDRNGAWIATRLAAAGIRVARRTTVGDRREAIGAAMREALDRTGVVLCTGGLGPTPDDMTRDAVAEVFGRELASDQDVLERIRQLFRVRGLEMPATNRVQAMIPEGAVILPNPIGTAPGLVLEDDRGRLAILVPGVPSEMRAILDAHVVPFLRSHWPGLHRPILHRVIRTTGIVESALAERIADLEPELDPLSLAFLPSPRGVDLRLTSWGDAADSDGERLLELGQARLLDRIRDFAYGFGDDDLATVVNRELERRGLTIAVAESCTGGLLGTRLTDPPGASAVVLGGVVAYSDALKTSILGVRHTTIERYGAVSAETAREMLEGIRRVTGAEAALSVTGIAGPSGGTPGKPVGTVWIGAALGDQSCVQDFRFGGDRAGIRDRAAQAALALLWRMLRQGET